MASVIQKQKMMAWCGTVGLATSLMIGCGSSKPPAPPAAPAGAPTSSAPGAGHMPMMASAPGAPGSPGAHGATPGAPGAMPGAGHAAPTMPSAPGQPGAPLSAHGPSNPGSPNPAQMMANAHGQPSGSGPTPTAPASNDPAAMMAKSHGQGAPGSNGAAMPMPLPGSGHSQPVLNPANAAAAGGPGAMGPGGAPGPAGAHAGNPNDPAMANPGGPLAGAPGGIGGPQGAAGPGGAGGPGTQFPAGTAEAALQKFCMAMADSNLTEAGEYISPKAKGLLAQIRDGSITDDKIDSLKESFAPQGLQLKPSRNLGTGKSITLSNAKNELLSFTLMKEDDAYLLREFKVSKQPANTRANGQRY